MTTKTHKLARHALTWTDASKRRDRAGWNARPTGKRVQR